MKPKVSIVVPVYNVSAYLNQCIESLVNQTEQNLEFIFVNDGSTDGSKKIVEAYVAKDSRIKLLNQRNSGVSAARNAGLQLASGDYIGFVDADDSVSSDMYQKLSEVAVQHNLDIVISDFFSEQGKAVARIAYPFKKEELLDDDYIKQTILPFFVRNNALNSVCNKIFRRALIAESQILFPTDRALGEDAIFNMRAFNSARRVWYRDYGGYHYREVSGSATRSIAKHDYFQKVLEAYHFNYSEVLTLDVSAQKVSEMKGVKFIESVMSLIHVYINATDSPLSYRYKAVKQMVTHSEVQKALKSYYCTLIEGKSRYSQFILKAMRLKWIGALFLAVFYSRLRNS